MELLPEMNGKETIFIAFVVYTWWAIWVDNRLRDEGYTGEINVMIN